MMRSWLCMSSLVFCVTEVEQMGAVEDIDREVGSPELVAHDRHYFTPPAPYLFPGIHLKADRCLFLP
jgi:hypothetical protein